MYSTYFRTGYVAKYAYMGKYVHCIFIDIKVDFNHSIHYLSEQDESVLLTVVFTGRLQSTDVTVYIGDGSGINK